MKSGTWQKSSPAPDADGRVETAEWKWSANERLPTRRPRVHALPNILFNIIYIMRTQGRCELGRVLRIATAGILPNAFLYRWLLSKLLVSFSDQSVSPTAAFVFRLIITVLLVLAPWLCVSPAANAYACSQYLSRMYASVRTNRFLAAHSATLSARLVMRVGYVRCVEICGNDCTDLLQISRTHIARTVNACHGVLGCLI